MIRPSSSLLAVAPLALLASTACGGSWRASPEPELAGIGVDNVGSATIVGPAELHRSNGSVLRAMMGKIPNMKVSFLDMSRCPAITLRSFDDAHGRDFPSVYIDGTHVRDTCVLQDLEARDVERVEVYPMGFTNRPGYGRSNSGLILVFLRSG